MSRLHFCFSGASPPSGSQLLRFSVFTLFFFLLLFEQTLVGHGGTITAVGYVKGMLVSSSTDCTVRIWRQERVSVNDMHAALQLHSLFRISSDVAF